MSRSIDRFVRRVALPGLAALIVGGVVATGFGAAATVHHTADEDGPDTNVIRSPQVYRPSVTAPQSGLRKIRHPDHLNRWGPTISRPESQVGADDE